MDEVTGPVRIYVSNIPDDVDDDFLDDIFASYEITCKIENRDEGQAEVVCQNAKDAEKVVALKAIPVEDGKWTLIVSPRKKKTQKKTILVKGLPQRTTESFLMGFFSAKKRGGPIEKIQLKQDETQAIITFKDAEDAKVAVERKDLKLRGNQLEVAYDLDTGSDENDDDDLSRLDQRTISVTGLTEELLDKELIEEAIQDVLEVEDDLAVENITINDNEGAAVIVLKDLQTAQMLVDKKTLMCYGQKLKVEDYRSDKTEKHQAPESDGVTILVKGLPNNLKEEMIKIRFESRKRKGGPTEYIQYNASSGTAIIKYKNPTDAAAMLSNEQLDMYGSTVSLEWYIEPPLETESETTVRVTNLPEYMDEDAIEDLFTNESRTGGGEIKGIQLFPNNEALVTFAELSVASRVKARESVELAKGHFLKVMSVPAVYDEVLHNKVLITGAQDIHEERIKMFLENPSRGGAIKSIEPGPQKGSFLVEYVNVEDAEKAVAPKEHMIRKQTIHLELYLEKSGPVFPTVSDQDIVVKGLGGEIDRGDLMDLLSNEGFAGAGADVTRLKLSDDGDSATVSFKEATTAKALVEKGSKVYIGQTLTFMRPCLAEPKGNSKESVMTTLEVSNIKPGTSTDHVKLFFENENKCGGGEIKRLSYNPSAGRALLQFQDSKRARRVLQKHETRPLKISDRCLLIREYDQEKLTKYGFSVNSCAVEIRGFPKSDSMDNVKEIITDLFSNERSSGGGSDLQNVFVAEDYSRAVIAYKTPKTAEKVLAVHQKKGIFLGDHKLNVQVIPCSAAVIPEGELEDKTIFLKDLPETIDGDIIRETLDNYAKANVQDVIFGTKQGTVLVTFETLPDFDHVFEELAMCPWDGTMISPRRIEISRTVEIYGIFEPKVLEEQIMKLYFENRAKSGGGEVDAIKIDKNVKCALITFKRQSDAAEVAKRSHTILKQNITVKLHHDCLGYLPESHDHSQPVQQIPKESRFDVESQLILAFIMQSSKLRTGIDSEIKKLHAVVKWPSEPQTATEVTIRCCLNKSIPNYRTLAKTWENSVKQCLQRFLSELLEDRVQVSAETLGDIEHAITKMNKDQSNVMLVLENSKALVKMAGYDMAVKDTMEKIKKLHENIKRKQERKQKMMKHVWGLEGYKIRYLQASEYKEAMEERFEDMTIEMDPVQGKITVHGTEEDRNAAELEMFRYIQKMKKRQEGMMLEMLNLFKHESVLEYARAVLKNKGLEKVAFERGLETITVYGDDEQSLSSALTVLTKCICDQHLELTDDDYLLMKSAEWKSEQDQLNKKHGKKLVMMELPSSIRILCTEDIINEVYSKLTGFLKSHVIEEEFVKTKQGEAHLLNNTDNLKHIADNLIKQSVMLKADTDQQRPGVSIKGSKEGIEIAKQEVIGLLEKVKTKLYKVKQPGMPAYFKHESAGQNQLLTVQNRCQVAIQEEDLKDVDDDEEDFGPINLLHVTLDRGVTLQIMQDNIVKQDGEMVLVSATKQITHTDAVAKRIVDAAGEGISQECSEHVSAKGNLRVAEVYVTKAGRLSYQNIVHVLFPPPSPTKNLSAKDERDLYEAFYESLKAAAKAGRRSLVIPGYLFGQYPSNVSAKMFTDVVSDYFSRYSASSLKQLTIVTGAQDKLESLKKIVVIVAPAEADNFGKSVSDKSVGKMLFRKGRDTAVITDNGVKIALVQGAIAKQTADVIVNTASRDLQLRTGRVSLSILTAGGQILQDECDKIFDTTGFHEGMVAETNPGKLGCKKVYHISCVNWSSGDNTVKQGLCSLIMACLTKASDDQMTSIAFPAVGTGNLGYPRDYVAKAMYEQVHKFSRANSGTSLKRVSFVIYDQDITTMTEFKKVARAVCEPGYHPVTLTLLRSSQKGDERRTNNASAATSDNVKRRLTHSGDMSGRSTTTRGGRSSPTATQAFGPLEITLDRITIKVLQGDITKEKTDVIVNSTNRDFTFNSPLSKAILRAAGEKLAAECKEKGCMRGHVAITTAGKMACKKVIHIDAPGKDINEWKSRIVQTLKLAEDNQLGKIAFPALGAGAMHIAPGIMSDTMLEAIEEFNDNENPRHLKAIRVVIFEKQMFGEFQEEFFNIASSAAYKKKGYRTTGAPGGRQSEQSRFSEGEDEDVYEDVESMFPDMATSHEQLQILSLEICGFHMSNINSAVEQLDKICVEESHAVVLDKKNDVEKIAKLTPEQIERIKSYEKKYPVLVRVDMHSHKKQISIEGRPRATSGVYMKIKEILLEADKVEDRRANASKLFQNVKWQFYEDEEYESYPPGINLLIEDAYKAQQSFAKWSEKDGEYRIDFSNMQEYPLGNRSSATPVRRYAPGLIELPQSWSPMDDKKEFEVVDLPPSNIDYEIVLNNFKESMSKKNNELKAIKSIKRIQNPRVYRTFMSNKNSVEMRNPTLKQIQRSLWHGTSEDALDDIHATGFNRAFCGKNGTVYGKGVYFATGVHTAHNFAAPSTDGNQNIYLCKVLTGSFTKGTSDMLVPPYIDEKTKKRYDSVTDRVPNPTIFAVFNDAMAYPEYLITYTANKSSE